MEPVTLVLCTTSEISLKGINASTAAIVAFREQLGVEGPLFMGRDTHALSEPAFLTALEDAAGGLGSRFRR